MHKNSSSRFVVRLASIMLSTALLAGCSQLNERPVRLMVSEANEECAGGISAQLSVDGSDIVLESPIVQRESADSFGWQGTTSETIARHTPMTVSAQCYAEGGEVIGMKKSRGSTDFSQTWQRDMVISVYSAASASRLSCEDEDAVLEESGVKICITGFDGRRPNP